MMTKKRAPLPLSSSSAAAATAVAATAISRGRLWIALQLIIWLSALACTIALLRIGAEPPSLALDAAGEGQPFAGVPKIAFLFLARSNLPLDFLWHTFFQNAEEDKYSIYIHSEPGFAFDRTTTRSPFFFGRQLQNSIKVIWGEATMIEAERLLLDAALQDSSNQRFALISDSCVPLYNFSYIYSYLMSSPKSFVDSFLDGKGGRYSPKMFPTIPEGRWRKGSQWKTLVRKHAVVVVADAVVFPVFRKFCKRLTGDVKEVPGRKENIKEAARKEHDCIPDEHYVQTLLSMNQLDDELERRTLTFTSWNQSTNATDKRSWHPKTFDFLDASPQQIMEIRNINHVDYETEYRTEWCQSNGTFVPCFLFARKFSRGAAMRILYEGFIGSFDAGALLFSNS